MKGDIPEVALRLCSTLPVRTHERRVYVHKQGSHQTKAIIIGKRRFPTKIAAKRAYHICTSTLDEWLRIGKASYE